jgi:DNA-binding response OmpR family regulator
MKILLVDDEESFLEMMGDALEARGFDVIRAGDGKQAREALEMEQIDLIISDVFMPTLDGERFHSYVRDLSGASEVPFIFLSGYDDERVHKLVVDPTKDFYFSKTTPLEVILTTIEKLDHP